MGILFLATLLISQMAERYCGLYFYEGPYHGIEGIRTNQMKSFVVAPASPPEPSTECSSF